MAFLRSPFLLFVALLLLLSGCARLSSVERTVLKPKSFGDLQVYLQKNKADLDLFRLRGPYFVTQQNDLEIRLPAAERINADLYLATHTEKAPLVIFVHGHDNSKESHALQAMHVASWGLHCLTLELPSHGPWVSNGKTLARVVDAIHSQPGIFDNRIDVTRIILVGHSFGGAAVTVALAEAARATGGILLDPATDERELPNYLRQIQKPVLVIGADEQVSAAVNRNYFFYYVRGGISEVSIKGAIHDDAQDPTGSLFSSEESHITFASTVTAGALSLAMVRRFDYAWASFANSLANGKLVNARKK